jgi:hypothetical protein
MPWPDNGVGRGHHNPGRSAQQITATNGNTGSIPDRGDPRRIGELLGDWLAVRMAEVDDLVAEARRKVDAIPEQRALWALFGELVIRVTVLEHEVAAMKDGRR